MFIYGWHLNIRENKFINCSHIHTTCLKTSSGIVKDDTKSLLATEKTSVNKNNISHENLNIRSSIIAK